MEGGDVTAPVEVTSPCGHLNRAPWACFCSGATTSPSSASRVWPAPSGAPCLWTKRGLTTRRRAAAGHSASTGTLAPNAAEATAANLGIEKKNRPPVSSISLLYQEIPDPLTKIRLLGTGSLVLVWVRR